jgi:hypothetical protein
VRSEGIRTVDNNSKYCTVRRAKLLAKSRLAGRKQRVSGFGCERLVMVGDGWFRVGGTVQYVCVSK